MEQPRRQPAMRVAFLQSLSSRRGPLHTCKELCKQHIVGGASITRATLAGALGRPLVGAVGLRGVWRTDFDLAAISFNTPGSTFAYRAAEELRACGKTVIAGGPHPSALPDEALRYFHAVCVGPGDAVFPTMVGDAERGRLGRVYHGHRGDWATPSMRKWPRLALVQTSRGCPERCVFCSVASMGPGDVDGKPLERVTAELGQAPRLISIVDDNFLADPDRARRVMKLLRDAGKRFICQATPDAASRPDHIQELARSGCVVLGVGIESISAESREFLGKSPGWDPREVVERVQGAGIACYVNLIFGSDGETPAIFGKTLEFVQEARPAIVSPHILTPFPATKLHAYLSERGRLLFAGDAFPQWWRLFDMRHVTFIPDPMSPEELRAGFAAFIRELFSLRRTVRRARARHLPMALLSSLLRNLY